MTPPEYEFFIQKIFNKKNFLNPKPFNKAIIKLKGCNDQLYMYVTAQTVLVC